MSNELIGQDRGVGLDLDKIDGHRGNFGKYCPTERVGEGEVDIAKSEIYPVTGGLYMGTLALKGNMGWPQALTSRTVTRGPTSSTSIVS